MPPTIIDPKTDSKKIEPGQFQNTGLTKKFTVKRASAMKSEGDSYVATWQDLSTYNYPTRGFFNSPTPAQGTKIDHKTLIDEEATFCVDTFASGMTSGFTSPSRPWFELFLDDDELMKVEVVKYWLDDVTKKMLDIFQRSGTYAVLNAMYAELSVFSTACAIIEEDFKNVISLRNFTCGEYYLACDKQGRVNAFYHRFYMKVGQMVSDFGIGNVSAVVQQAYQSGDIDKWILINHLIEENEGRVPYLKDFWNMPFRSIYWEDGSKDDDYLRIGGYEEFPLLVPRWDTTTTADSYGKGGPGWKALGSVKELQKKVKNLLIGLDKESNPPLQKDASVTGEVNTLPGGITTSSALVPNAGVRPTYQVQLNLANLDASIEKTKQKIRKFYFTDLFLMMIQAERSGTPITATEIIEKQSEKLSILGPILERWQGDDFVKALIERTFNIGMRNSQSPDPSQNVFPPSPQELQGKELKIRYTSILAQAQRMQEIVAINQWVSEILSVAQANPAIIDNINFDGYAQEKAKMLGIPARIINSPEAMAALRKARAKITAEAEAQKKMLILAEAANKGAGAVKDMSAAPIGENSALDSTLEAIKGANPR
ncbi:MAG: hypothetical protein EHM87_19590 [Burkholderiales bacterium]|nr:MAG: hypothetical protein EHM87_19590 [Burkholderiales bacterium]